MSSNCQDAPGAKRNLAAACFLMFLTGSVLSLGVFNSDVENSARPAGSLDGVWSSSITLMTLCSCLSAVSAGFLLGEGKADHNEQPPTFLESKTNRVRFLSLLGALGFACLGFGALGAVYSNSLMLRAAVIVQGIPYGFYYIVCIELLGAWMPKSPGLAVGLGQMAFGFGPVAFSALFAALLKSYSFEDAIRISAVTLSTLSAICVPVLGWPKRDNVLENLGVERPESRQMPSAAKMTWKQLQVSSRFWFYIVVVFVTEGGFALIPYFFTVGLSFGKTTDELVVVFQILFFVSTLTRPFAGIVADRMKTTSGYFAMGSKNLSLLLLALQALLFTSLGMASVLEVFEPFAAATCLLFVVFAGAACGNVILAREVFGPDNSALVYGIGGSSATGLGELVFGQLLVYVNAHIRSKPAIPSDYNSFYVFAAVMSIFGLISCALLSPQRKAIFHIRNSSGRTSSSHDMTELLFTNEHTSQSYGSAPFT